MELVNYSTKKYPKSQDMYLIREAKGEKISNPANAYNLFRTCFNKIDCEREHFLCASLNTKNKVISLVIISIGNLSSCIVDPREVFYAAIANRAASIIVAHNHPSDDPTPSQNDIEITNKLRETGKIIGIELFDHIIFGHDRFESLKESGWWN